MGSLGQVEQTQRKNHVQLKINRSISKKTPA